MNGGGAEECWEALGQFETLLPGKTKGEGFYFTNVASKFSLIPASKMATHETCDLHESHHFHNYTAENKAKCINFTPKSTVLFLLF